jgi:NADPH:quinone reductase-like Zn-dependent oxidoreductase
MKAIINTEYGSADVLKLQEIEKPIPKPNEVLVKIYGTTVNRTDTGLRSAEYFISRLFTGLFKPRFHTLGSEFAGIIEQIGEDVKSFKVGDEIFGLSTSNFGTHAEYLAIPESASIALKPKNFNFYEAACIGEGPYLALNYLEKFKIDKTTKILINGTSGSIGSSGLQLAKYFGAEVTAVTDTKNIALAKTLGADFVVDYTKEDFINTDKKFDLVFDAVGKSSFFKCKKLLKENGTYFSTELGYLSQNVYLPLFTKKIIFPIPKDTKEKVG